MCLYPGPLYLPGYLDIGHSSRWTVGACILGPCMCPDIWTLAGGLWVPVSWFPVFARIFGHWLLWQVDLGCLCPGPLHIPGYLEIGQSGRWTVGACILVPCVCPDIWTLAGGLWVPVSWAPVFARIFGHWPVDCGCPYPGSLYLPGYLDIGRWTVGARILGPCICPDIWTLARVAGRL